MKTYKFSHLTFIGLLSILLFASCKKEGCTDKKASNYNSAAEKDDGSCKYATKEVDTTTNDVVMQLVNEDFENWEHVGEPTEEPYRWSSLQTADALASSAPDGLDTTLGHTGMYGVKLTVPNAVFGIVANGILTTGRVHASFNPEEGYVYTDVSSPEWYTPFVARPDSLVGWYKYAPTSGDHGKIEVLLHKGTHARIPRDATTISNQVGDATFQFTTAKSEWTRFSVPFHYTSSDNPEYVLGVIQAGDSTVAKVGTTVWIDDVKLIYNN